MDQRLIPTLHHLDHSSSFRCLWALEELREANGIVYRLKTYRRQRGQAPPELSRVFPIGKSPILTLESTVEGEDPPTLQIAPGILTEALLILRFLKDEYGNGLWGPADGDKNRDAFFQAFAVMTLASRLELLVVLDMTILFFPFGISALARLILFPVMMVLKRGLVPIFQLLEDALTEEKPWFSGSQFGLADFNVCWGMDTASQRGYFNPARFPRLVEWHAKVKARAGYQSALEKGNGYNLKTFGV